jgi:hypothetical protein
MRIVVSKICLATLALIASASVAATEEVKLITVALAFAQFIGSPAATQHWKTARMEPAAKETRPRTGLLFGMN